jgi:hypothetical protein
MKLRLRGLTGHGKNRIREHGDEWFVIEPKVTPKPTALFIESAKTGDKRWLNHHFEIIEETNEQA